MLGTVALILQDLGRELPEEMPISETGLAAIGAGVAVLYILLAYVYPALCIHFIAKKTGTSPAWLAWIPIANIVLLLMVAEKPMWWLILLFIPIVNLVWIVFGILIWMSIAEKRGKPSWIGILMIVPLLNFVILGYLAFSK